MNETKTQYSLCVDFFFLVIIFFLFIYICVSFLLSSFFSVSGDFYRHYSAKEQQ